MREEIKEKFSENPVFYSHKPYLAVLVNTPWYMGSSSRVIVFDKDCKYVAKNVEEFYFLHCKALERDMLLSQELSPRVLSVKRALLERIMDDAVQEYIKLNEEDNSHLRGALSDPQ